jgi:hypothetical protein
VASFQRQQIHWWLHSSCCCCRPLLVFLFCKLHNNINNVQPQQTYNNNINNVQPQQTYYFVYKIYIINVYYIIWNIVRNIFYVILKSFFKLIFC